MYHKITNKCFQIQRKCTRVPHENTKKKIFQYWKIYIIGKFMYNFFWTARLCQDLWLLHSLLANYHDSTLQLKNSLGFFSESKKNPWWPTTIHWKSINNGGVHSFNNAYTIHCWWPMIFKTLSFMYVYWHIKKCIL